MLRTFALASAVTLALSWTYAPAEEAWQTVRSKAGQFTIELPVKPTINQTRDRKAAGGRERSILLGCTTDSGAYIAYKIILPTAIVKGTEDQELDAERDALVKEWRGKLLAERRIRAGEKVGRDFTVRGRPEKGAGVLTLRVREYLAGRAVYLMAVASLPNRELPDDAGRFLGSLVIGTQRAEGSPGAEPKGVPLPPWGEAIDPKKDSEVKGDKTRVEMKLLGRRKGPASSLDTPRVMREVEGDFVISVKVVGDFRPGGRSTNPGTVPFDGAGILVWSDRDNYIRLERAAINRRGKIYTYVNFEVFEGGTRAGNHNERMQGGDCWVRMERKGSRIHGSISFDGKTWKDLKPMQTVWPAKLKVGVAATSSSSLPFKVVFEEYQFKGKLKLGPSSY
jgi:regulation of enolase protein 1 (concanavalin A-like superfamily)